MRFTLSEVARLVGGDLLGADTEFDGVSVDSRRLERGELFVPLIADRDGHDFIAHAAEAGAAASLARRDRLSRLESVGMSPDSSRRLHIGAQDRLSRLESVGIPLVAVADTQLALRQLGVAARDRITATVVGITGSVGKTSTKDLLAAALRHAGPVHASPASFNNSIGVPLTLLSATGHERAVIAEIGTNAPGEIADLAALARPQLALVTAVGAAHTAAFGTLEAVAQEKSALVAALPAAGTAVLNADDERVAAMAELAGAQVLSYGFDKGDVRATNVTLDNRLRASFHLETPWGRAPVRLQAAGWHMAHNATGAATVALALGAGLAAVAEGLGQAQVSRWRMSVDTSPVGALIINDAYNANPSSVAAALRSLASLPASRRVAVLGPMAELGDSHAAEHAAVAELASELDIEVLAVAEPSYGTPTVPDVEAAVAALGPLGPDDAVLVKASRIAGLERLAVALLAPKGTAAKSENTPEDSAADTPDVTLS